MKLCTRRRRDDYENGDLEDNKECGNNKGMRERNPKDWINENIQDNEGV